MSTIRKKQIIIAMKFPTLKNTKKIIEAKLNGFTVFAIGIKIEVETFNRSM